MLIGCFHVKPVNDFNDKMSVDCVLCENTVTIKNHQFSSFRKGCQVDEGDMDANIQRTVHSLILLLKNFSRDKKKKK